MKLQYLLIAFLIAFVSCDNNDDSSFLPNKAVTKAFQEKFPHASQTDWKYKYNYLTVEFFNEGNTMEAWFSQDGAWYMTKTEFTRKDQLPPLVVTAFDNSSYSDWTIDEIDRLERANTETLYVIEVKKSNQEYELYFSLDGILVKELPDDENDDYENYLPENNPDFSVLTEFIEKKYPGARLVEIETKTTLTEADIIHDNRKKEVVFNQANEWLNTHYDVREEEVNSAVMKALANSPYSTYYKDDIEKYETPAGEFYLFELEQGKQEIKITIDSEGIIKVI